MPNKLFIITEFCSSFLYVQFYICIKRIIHFFQFTAKSHDKRLPFVQSIQVFQYFFCNTKIYIFITFDKYQRLDQKEVPHYSPTLRRMWTHCGIEYSLFNYSE
jgi:hypothetical protein